LQSNFYTKRYQFYTIEDICARMINDFTTSYIKQKRLHKMYELQNF